MSNPRLENWCAVIDNPHVAPELQQPRLQGAVYGHPLDIFEDGDEITTAVVEEFDLENRIAKTKSGSVYSLGTPENKYVDYLKRVDSDKYQLVKRMLDNDS